ncbi:MAG: toll/interleukin-1 receptor domain-containing protein [Oscillospiraceae bacterium]|nr:toll/interleukin-1 receptor domain-containing protein [Oscillospiraceae bacterium]
MSVMIKCKMCGGDLALTEGSSLAVCEYCGTQQTVPFMDDEKKLVQFERADRLRRNCEFDKASGVYESIVADFWQEAEAYWGLVLCKYGIEYVDDPASGKKVPTCHRSSFDSVMEDRNFELVMENASDETRKVYREEAKQIEEIRKGIIEVSVKEEPYDIFICYKETDANGQRTVDSVMAQSIYDSLTQKGYRVFFSRISLEDKLGQEYEPYIFAALNSAKLMLVIGTDYDHFNAVWVKNEWSRFLKLMEKDSSKHLIPCYNGIDAYDIPKEFGRLQAQDLGKIGATQDLLRGIDKLIAVAPAPVQQGPVLQADDINRIYVYNSAMDAMKSKKIKTVKTAVQNFTSLGDWNDAKAQLANAQARLKKLKRKRLVRRLITWLLIFSIIGAGVGAVLKVFYDEKMEKYEAGISYMNKCDYYDAYKKFNSISGFKDADELAADMLDKVRTSSAALEQLQGEFRSNLLINATEIYFSFMPSTSNVNGEKLCTDNEWIYVGPALAINHKDPASMARYAAPNMAEKLMAGEIITDIDGKVVHDAETGKTTLVDFDGNSYTFTKNADGITISGGDLFGDGFKLSYSGGGNDGAVDSAPEEEMTPEMMEELGIPIEKTDFFDLYIIAYEHIAYAFNSGMVRDDGATLGGWMDHYACNLNFNNEALSEFGFVVIDPEDFSSYCSTGDPNWMLHLIPDADWENNEILGYTVEIIGSGCPYDIAGYYHTKF